MEPNSYSYSRLRREQLPDLIQCRLEKRPLPISELPQTLNSTPPNELVAIWQSRYGEDPLLPNLVTGAQAALDDMMAWALVYMAELGPLSAIIRLLPSEKLRSLLEPRKPHGRKAPNRAAMLGIVLGEFCARSGRTLKDQSITVSSASGTLSYCIFRSDFSQAPSTHADVSKRWKATRAIMKTGSAAPIDHCVETVCNLVTNGQTTLSDDAQSHLLFEQTAHHADFNSELLWRRIMTHFFDNETADLRASFTGLSAEEKVRRADALFTRITRSKRSRSECSMALAAVAAAALPDFFGQHLLIENFADRHPEATIWLGALQAETNLASLLSSFPTLGWKLIAGLEEQIDVFSRPSCDISFEEISILATGEAARSAISASAGKLSVELVPGVSTVLQLSDDKATRQSKRSSIREDDLAALDHHLRQAVDALTILRSKR